MLRRTFLRRCTNFSLSLRAITDRLDSFEKEMIELKAFRQAVSITSPDIAQKAEELMQSTSRARTTEERLELPLTADEFIEMTQFYAFQKPNPILVSHLRNIRDEADLIAHANLIQRESLIRLALLSKSLSVAPYGFSQMPAIKELNHWYQLSFHEFTSFPPPTCREDLLTFDRLLRTILLRHYNASRLLCDGLVSLAEREHWGDSAMHQHENFPDLKGFFDTFYTDRAKFRFCCGNAAQLCNQILQVPKESYAALDKEGVTHPAYFNLDPKAFVGILCHETSLLTLTKCCIKDIQARYEDAKIHLRFHGDESLTIFGIPYITYDIISALICDAIEENLHTQQVGGTPPTDIEVTLVQAKSSSNFVLRVSDTAGGMNLNDTKIALSCWSTFRNFSHVHTSELASGDTWIHSAIRLSYASCAANIIGGRLSVASIEGYGTDRQLYLPTAGVSNVSM